jgi:hypothetical protein
MFNKWTLDRTKDKKFRLKLVGIYLTKLHLGKLSHAVLEHLCQNEAVRVFH